MRNYKLIEKGNWKNKDGIMSSPHSVYQVACQSVDREARAIPIPGRRGCAGEFPSYLLVDLGSDGIQAASGLPISPLINFKAGIVAVQDRTTRWQSCPLSWNTGPHSWLE